MIYIIVFLTGVIFTYCYMMLRPKWITNNKQLIKQEKRLIELVENSRDGFYYLETLPKIRFLYSHPSFEVTFGEEKGKLVYENPEMAFERVHPDDRELLNKKICGKIDYNKAVIYRVAIGNENFEKGIYTLFEEYTTPVYKDGQLVAIQGVLRDITDKLELERQLQYRITHDSLTGLYNREYFESQMDEYTNYVNTSVSIIIIDLDNLKSTNDTYGHRHGDKLIKQAANILNNFSTDNIIVSRIGGDEFVIIMLETNFEDNNNMVANISLLLHNYNYNNPSMNVQFSIGYAFSEHSIGNMETLYIEADQMMYENKRNRKLYQKIAME